MGIIAWIVLGLFAGLIANALIPGRRQQGLILTCVIGIVGALLGGWLATKLFHIHTLHGFFNLDTWITAIVGAVILLLAYHLITSRGHQQQQSRPQSHPPVRAQVKSPVWPVGRVISRLDRGGITRSASGSQTRHRSGQGSSSP